MSIVDNDFMPHSALRNSLLCAPTVFMWQWWPPPLPQVHWGGYQLLVLGLASWVRELRTHIGVKHNREESLLPFVQHLLRSP